jgi:osmotically inducible protein OsmC
MATRTSEAVWEGTLREGTGRVKLGSGAFEGPYSFRSRFEEGAGTNPEELVGAAHAGCFSMALAAGLSRAKLTPRRIHTTARVHLENVDGSFRLTRIELETEAEVPGLDARSFADHAETAKKSCPLSVALSAVPITLDARLL